MASTQDLVDRIADRLGTGVSLDDLDGHLVAYSSQHGRADDVRVRAVLDRRAPSEVRSWEQQHGSTTASAAFVVPGNADLGMGPRICVPLASDGVRTGLLFLLEDDPTPERVAERLATVGREVAELATVLAASSVRPGARVVVQLSAHAAHTSVVGPGRWVDPEPGALGTGTASASGERGLGTTHHRALVAAQASTVDPALGRVVDWTEIGIYQVLSSAAELPESALLARLEARDPDGTLAQTLERLYDHVGPVREVADLLHLHRTGLYHRLTRVRALIGADPLQGQARLELHLALKARRWALRPQASAARSL